jgi:hypothetical protein
MQAFNIFEVLSAMITPSVLISATGLLVLSTSNRLSRVVDRVRSVASQVRNLDRTTDVRNTKFIQGQLQILSKRAILLRSALTSLYIAITMFIATSILLAIVSVFVLPIGWLAVGTALIGSAFLFYGSILLISEARHAIASTLQEMNEINKEIDALRLGG